MRKTYPLHPEGRHPQRVLEAIRHDIRREWQRIRGKPVPAGFDRWDFDCRFGADAASAQAVGSDALLAALDAAAAAGAAQAYVEILPRAALRGGAPAAEAA